MSAWPHRLFLPQEAVEAWLDADRVVLHDDVLAVVGRPGTFHLAAAVRFRRAIPEGPSRLLGKVMTEAQIEQLGGELLGDSVLFGDVGFEVENGYVGTRS